MMFMNTVLRIYPNLDDLKHASIGIKKIEITLKGTHELTILDMVLVCPIFILMMITSFRKIESLLSLRAAYVSDIMAITKFRRVIMMTNKKMAVYPLPPYGLI